MLTYKFTMLLDFNAHCAWLLYHVYVVLLTTENKHLGEKYQIYSCICHRREGPLSIACNKLRFITIKRHCLTTSLSHSKIGNPTLQRKPVRMTCGSENVSFGTRTVMQWAIWLMPRVSVKERDWRFYQVAECTLFITCGVNDGSVRVNWLKCTNLLLFSKLWLYIIVW